MKINLSLALFITSVFFTCTGKKSVEQGNLKQGVKFEQYLVEGQLLYEQHCANCHQVNGLGLGELYPPLANSDYLLENQEAVICLIKNGIAGELTVNGIQYNQPMPGVSTLKNLEIAEIATYIYNSWGNKKGQILTDSVESILTKCASN